MSDSTERRDRGGAAPRLADEIRCSTEDAQLLDELARRVVRAHMGAAALFTLESMTPLNRLGAAAMHFFQPLASAFVDTSRYERLAHLLDQRDVMAALVAHIEALEDERCAGEAAARRQRATRRRGARDAYRELRRRQRAPDAAGGRP